MELSYIGITEKKEKQFRAKGIESVEDLISFIPLRYNDFSRETGIVDGDFSSMTVTCRKVNYVNKRIPFVSAICTDSEENEIHVSWFNQNYIYSQIRPFTGRPVFLCGKITYNAEYGHYSCTNPPVFSVNTTSSKRIYPVYSKIRGMSEDYLSNKVAQALHDCSIKDLVPESVRTRYDVVELNEAYKLLHVPSSMEDIKKGAKRLAFDEILYFALRMEEDGSALSKGSQYNIRSLSAMKAMESKITYELTQDQKDVINDIIEKGKDGRRVSALVQGDVGCGKSIVAFLAAAAFAGSGYQVAIMAPTQVLAEQHYKELSDLANEARLTCALYAGSKMKAAEKRAMLKAIKNGDINIVVGTHALLGKDVEYANLALTIVDEEHKFGVVQKQALIEKASSGVHSITMSATPIPRSLSQVIYGDTTDIYTIKEMPPGRQRVKTCVTGKRELVYNFVEKELAKGHQAYIVCPAIEKNEKKDKLKSVEEIGSEYRKRFGDDVVVTLTGKNKKDEVAAILENFALGKAKILVATTVIEVGVNVPNATVIVIENSENFGLAALHQLRGRVGRGKAQGYCIFMTEELENARLAVLSHTTDGFEIAEKDMKMRGAGEFIGVKQSGEDKYVSIILSSEENKQMHVKLKKDAGMLIDSGKLDDFLASRKVLLAD